MKSLLATTWYYEAHPTSVFENQLINLIW